MKPLSLLRSLSYIADCSIHAKSLTSEEIAEMRRKHEESIPSIDVKVSAKKEIQDCLTILRGNGLDTPQKVKWKKYRKVVWKITNNQPLHCLPNIEHRGFRKMHLDHKISVWYGFKNNISEEVIGHISNLEMIPHHDNLKKGTKCKYPPVIFE